ncbi:MAG: LemA family protein [Nitriliruptoraceae bacterium]
MSNPLLWIAAAVVIAAVWGVLAYNRFVAQTASMDATWANIATELQRRHELVPNLVATVEGYADHERELLEAVVDARARAVDSVPDEVDIDSQARVEDELTDRLTGLLAISEDHPELKADTLFADLQRQLIETEDRISAARRLYNLEVAAYQRRRRSIPTNLIAWAAELPPRRPFEIRDASAAHAPQVFGVEER